MGFSGFDKVDGSGKAFIDPDYVVRVDEYGEDRAVIFTADGNSVMVEETALRVLTRLEAERHEPDPDYIKL